ncbi:MAG TPA: hypothetical protein VIM89_11560 [Mucilaginibacter sp.]
MYKALYFIALLWLTTSFTYKNDQEVRNYYSIPEILTFGNVQYKLMASYHPNDMYYKQEYIPAGESIDHFNRMIFIDIAIVDATPREMLDIKANELQDRKKTDPIVNYEILENKDKAECMLDFILSDGAGNKTTVVERNVYRYKSYSDKSGHRGVLLFSISQRGYDKDIPSFLKNLKTTRVDDLNKVGQYNLPDIGIK